jgi:hypothetical protein
VRAIRRTSLSVVIVMMAGLLAACSRQPADISPETVGMEKAAVLAAPPVSDERLTVPANRVSDVAPFAVVARATALTSAPCSSCHTVPLERLRRPDAGMPGRAHWNITLEHASEAVLSCTTCHRPDDLDGLRMLGGARVSFDHAYELCAQCHSPQRADWEGGAHGKRVGGWAPPRVVMNCTGCHDPHTPALDTRWPARAGVPRVPGGHE